MLSSNNYVIRICEDLVPVPNVRMSLFFFFFNFQFLAI